MVTNREFYRLFIRYITTVNDKDDEPPLRIRMQFLPMLKNAVMFRLTGLKSTAKQKKRLWISCLPYKINGDTIRVKYETDVGGFKPDFYLSQYELFIEHWGINKDSEVPAWFSQSSQKYRDLMEHKEMVC